MQQKNLIGLVIATSLGLSALAGCVVTPGGVAGKAGTTTATPGGAKVDGTATVQKPGGTVQPGKTVPTAAAKPVAVGNVPAQQAQAGAVASQETAAALNEEREMEDYDTIADQEAGAAAYGLAMVGASAEGEVSITSAQAGADALRAGADALRAGDDALRAGDAALRAGDAAVRPGAQIKRSRAELGNDAIIEARLGGGKLTADQETKLRAAAAKVAANRAAFDARRTALKAHAAALTITSDVKLKVAARRKQVGERVKVRLDKLQDARVKIRGAAAKAPWVTNEDGSKTRTITFDVTRTVNGKTFTRKATLVRTINADGVLVLASADFQQTLANGLSRTSSRTKTLNEDGSYSVVFHSELVLPKGGKRVAHWEKEISAEGTVTGTGKIVWTDAAGAERKTVTIALGGSEETPVAAVEDAAAGTEAEVTLGTDGTIEASVEANGETEAVAIDVDADGAVSVAADDGAVSVGADGAIVVTDGEATVSSDAAGTTATDGNGDTATVGADGSVSASDGDAAVNVDAAGNVTITDN